MWSVPEHTRKNTGEYWSDIKPRRGRVTENKILSCRAAKVTKSDQNLKENVVTLIVFKLWCTNQPSVRWCRARRMFPSDRSDSIRTKGSNKLQHIVWLWLKRLFCQVSVNRWELLLGSSHSYTPVSWSRRAKCSFVLTLQENLSSSIFQSWREVIIPLSALSQNYPENPNIISNKQTECTHTLTHAEKSEWKVSMWQLSTADRDFFISHQSLGWIKDIDWLHLTLAASRVSGGGGQPVTSRDD